MKPMQFNMSSESYMPLLTLELTKLVAYYRPPRSVKSIQLYPNIQCVDKH